MIRPPFHPSRRHVVWGLAAAATLQPFRQGQAAGEPFAITIKEGAGAAIFDPALPSRFRLGDQLRLSVTSALATPIAFSVRGLDGVRPLEPLFGRPLLEPGMTSAIDVPLAQAGTFLLDARLLGDGLLKPLPVAAFAVAETAPPQADQDHLLLVEDARSLADGTAIGPGRDAGEAQAVYTVNGQKTFGLELRTNERLRLRLINGCQRNAIALQFDDHDIRIIAVDSRPAEPFIARDRRIVLAPGGRIDAMLDAIGQAGSTSSVRLFDGAGPKIIGQLTYGAAAPMRPEPLPPPGPLPDAAARLDLTGAFRAPIDFGASAWLRPQDLVGVSRSPLFRVRRGRTVLLTLTNRTATPSTLHLHGHHVRWLDRLDDGWKPFLPDTLLVGAGQTERIAFVAQYPGDWLIESAAMDWSASRRVLWFAVD